MKIITHSKCIAVAFENSKITAPSATEPNSVWIIQKGGFRWICPNNNKQSLVFLGQPTKIGPYTEVLFDSNQLLVKTGTIHINNQKLSSPMAYQFINNRWQISISKAAPNKLKLFDETHPLPIESYKMPAKQKERATRWVMGPTFGGSSMIYHKMSDLKLKDTDAEGFRFLTNFPYKNWSIIMGLNFIESEVPEGKNTWCDHVGPCEPNDRNDFNAVEANYGDIGVRFSPDKSWSWFAKIGMGTAKYRIHTGFDLSNSGFYSFNHEVEYLLVTLSFGVDKTFDWDWFGLYISAELFAQNAVLSLGENVERWDDGNDPGPVPDQYSDYDGAFINTGLLLYFGPMLRF